MFKERKKIGTVKVPTDPKETWMIPRGFGETPATLIGAKVYKGGVVVLFLKREEGTDADGIQMQKEALDSFCKEWLLSRFGK